MLAEHVPVVTHEDDHGVVVLACGTQRANDLADALVDCQQRLAALPIRLLSSAIWSLDSTGKSLMKGPLSDTSASLKLGSFANGMFGKALRCRGAGRGDGLDTRVGVWVVNVRPVLGHESIAQWNGFNVGR